MKNLIINFVKNRCLNMQHQQQLTHSNVHPVKHVNTLFIANECLQNGDVIALPTDTVYGLACFANNENAIKKLYNIKGRDSQKPVAICVHDIAALRCYGHAEHLPEQLLDDLLPGPITIVLKRTSQLSNPFLNPNNSLIGMRIPDFQFIRELCALNKNQALALTSANRSSQPSTLQVQEFAALWPQLGAVCDAGQLGLSESQRSASTVVDLANPGFYKIVREGIALKYTLDILHKYGLCNTLNNSKTFT